MSKKGIIAISVVSAIVLLLIILFAGVFCLRVQTVRVINGATLQANSEEIISTANFKKGKSIFTIDKDGATSRIEKKYPYIKVVQIKTTGVDRIEICVRAREAMYYVSHNGTYFILDEDLKVLNTVQSMSYIEETYTSLINLNTHKSDDTTSSNYYINDLGITNNTAPCDFVGNDFYKNVAYNLFTSMHNTVKVSGEDGEKHYAERADIRKLIAKVEFGTGNTLKEEYRTLIIHTTDGVEITIAKPQVDLEHKINVCFSAYDTVEEAKKPTCKIKYIYNKDGEEQIGTIYE